MTREAFAVQEKNQRQGERPESVPTYLAIAGAESVVCDSSGGKGLQHASSARLVSWAKICVQKPDIFGHLWTSPAAEYGSQDDDGRSRRFRNGASKKQPPLLLRSALRAFAKSAQREPGIS
jgi:hypothetical protein